MTEERSDLTADEIEQRRRADGGFDEAEAEPGEQEPPASPDVIEQRQTPEGDVEGDVDPALEEPLTPDEIEQRQAVESDEDWYEPEADDQE